MFIGDFCNSTKLPPIVLARENFQEVVVVVLPH